ncbi:ABC transporter ATP-binding protein [Desulfofustis limnaeus]|jgi:putative ABC transport system ATP-binding protein|nr:ABC transporter ATP-binding protein [Desulfofustis limnaeus]MDX9894162.1 ABC transporter ATP-binding protein [Desulfofustis sp.]
MTDSILESRHLTKQYRVGPRNLLVLDDVSLAFKRGEFAVITGKSGSGKTTLLSLLSCLDRPTSGQILLDGRDITALNEEELAPVRNQSIGFVFQSFHLIPSLNAIENVMFPAELRHDPAAEDKATRLLEQVGLYDRRYHFVQELSGGEKQRVAICRALINEPPLVFADEPTGNLDSTNSEEVLRLLLELQRERGVTLIMATHSPDIAARADRRVHLSDGRLAENNRL